MMWFKTKGGNESCPCFVCNLYGKQDLRMKKYFIILVISVLSFAGFSQQLSTSGQSNLKYYNKAIERLQKMTPGSVGYDEVIMDAERKIASIKKTDPGYNVSPQEEEIKKYKQGNAKKNEVTGKTFADIDKELNSFLTWGLNEFKNSKTDADYMKMSNKVDEQISLLSAFCKSDLALTGKKYQHKIEDYWNISGPDETEINSTRKYYENSEERNVYSYYQIKWLYNKWKLFSETYSESEDMKEALQKAEEVFKMIGSESDAKKHTEKVKANRIAQTKMNPATVNDPELENQIKTAVLNSKFGIGKEVIKVNIHSSTWTLQKNNISGVTLSRTKGFSAAIKEKDGRCSLLHYADFKQDYVGGTFAKGYVNLGEVVEILCENVK